jgi:lysophosphatidylcholine acyltransferase/lyso-PAF acetyltransferase
MSESVSNAPIVGKGFLRLAEILDSVILDRGSEKSRSEAKQRIHDKLQHMKSVGTGERLLIFPEGTLTNGEYVVPFKLGAFESLVPCQPLRIEFSNPHYSISDVDTVTGTAFMLCLNGTNMTMTWGPVVSPTKGESVEDFALRTRSALVKGSGIMEAKEGSFRDHMALFKAS